MHIRKLALALMVFASASAHAQYGMQSAVNPLSLLAPLGMMAAPLMNPYAMSNPMGMMGMGGSMVPAQTYNPQAMMNPYLNPMAANNPYLNPMAGRGNPYGMPAAPAYNAAPSFFPMMPAAPAPSPAYGGYGMPAAPAPAYGGYAAPIPMGMPYYAGPAAAPAVAKPAPAAGTPFDPSMWMQMMGGMPQAAPAAPATK